MADLGTNRQELGPAWQAAEAEGIDVSLLEGNLRRTPQERIRAHSRALMMAKVLQQGVKVFHESHSNQSLPAGMGESARKGE